MRTHGKPKARSKVSASQTHVPKTKPHPRGVFRFKTFEEFNTFKAMHHLSDQSPTGREREK